MKRTRLEGALTELVEEGVLDEAQRERVQARIAQALFGSADPAGRFVALVGALGGVLMGLGVIYLVAYNWQELGKPLQLAVTLGGWLGLHVAGHVLSEGKGRAPALGRAFTVAGVLAFGAAVHLVAQIYHLSGDGQHMILAWWLTSVPFALATRSVPILYITAALAVVWGQWQSAAWLEQYSSAGTANLATFGLLSVGLGALFVALAGRARESRWADFAPHLGGFGVCLAVAAAYALSFDEVWDRGVDWRAPRAVFVPFFVTGGSALVTAALGGAAARVQRLRTTGLVLAGGAALATSVAVFPEATAFVGDGLLIATVVALVAHGLRQHAVGYVNLGVAVFVLTATTWYFKHLWDKLEGSIAFFATGALLLALVTVVERRRRSWTRLAREVQP